MHRRHTASTQIVISLNAAQCSDSTPGRWERRACSHIYDVNERTRQRLCCKVLQLVLFTKRIATKPALTYATSSSS
jgi:hypothetical protein